MAELAELKHMVMSFRVSELQVLLGFAGRNKSGRKHELLSKALHLLKSNCNPAVQIKIKELYRRRFPRKILSPSELPMLTIKGGTLSSSTAMAQGAVSQLPYDASPTSSVVPGSVLTSVPLIGQKHELDFQHISSPVHPVHPDVKMKKLPFYEVYDELIKPTTLATNSGQRFEEAYLQFALTPQQVQQILTSRDLLNVAKCDYTVQVQLRFCLCETSCPQEDYFPPNLFVKVNGKLCQLPGYLPPTKNGVEPKRPSRPINITHLVRLSATVPNAVTVNWSSEYGRSYSVSVYLVKQLTSVTLLQRLRAKGIRNPDHSRALIKEKLTADPDSEIATTSLRVSLMCPLGKMRLTVPCRAITCTHLQCFDAALYLQMNEKKPTWTCPVCDKKAPYENLIIDGLFMEILNSCTDSDEIQFMQDGCWYPMRERKEKPDVCSTPAYNTVEDAKHSTEVKNKVEVIDLTLDSSSDEDEPPPKKQCPIISTTIPSPVGHKGLLNLHHQPSSVVRSPPMTTLSTDYIPNQTVSDYLPTYPLPSDIQDLFSFFQTEGQMYNSSLMSSAEEQDPLQTSMSHFFQYSSAQHLINPLVIGATHSVTSSTNRSSSIVSTSSLRENHGLSGSMSNSSGGTIIPGCRSDIISLD
ncbi:E3 SUMO-protein ligase PIAS3 isoform X1 [Protopterus annectens]|uniref:E3 SUMO-protein ligase PIAS3 isoform X1 n=2 Tax=Protopterus annectens TaxID=7888 RepID=UPI001CFAEFF9|nr:E3 SUMO-protein ligase PIAS3 isoform X1 [Protopterus annectens]